MPDNEKEISYQESLKRLGIHDREISDLKVVTGVLNTQSIYTTKSLERIEKKLDLIPNLVTKINNVSTIVDGLVKDKQDRERFNSQLMLKVWGTMIVAGIGAIISIIGLGI